MRGWTKLGLAGLTLGLMGGCAWIEFADVERLQQSGTNFDRTLYDGYLELSRGEYVEGDLVDQHRFAERARMAAGGESFEPETLSFRELSGEQRGKLGDARFRLMKVLNSGARENAPQDSAKAQVAFDCWMQESEEGDSVHAERCRNDFEAALARATAAPAPAAAAAEPEMPALPGAKTILFGFNSDSLTGEGKATLDQAITDWAGAKAKWLVVSGYADRVGDDAYNKGLSERRADAAVLYLLDQGFPARNISVRSLGEEELAVDTADNTAETRNRRVVITYER